MSTIWNFHTLYAVAIGLLLQFSGCKQASKSLATGAQKVIQVDPLLFQRHTGNLSVKLVNCTLTDGTQTKCYEIVTRGVPDDHEVGPFCPEDIQSTHGGKWYFADSLVDVDGSFVASLSEIYHDDHWKMYNEEGDVHKTEGKEECDLISLGQISDQLINHCIDCQISYISDEFTRTFLIPASPKALATPKEIVDFAPGGATPPGRPAGAPNGELPPPRSGEGRPDGPPPGGGAQVRGIAFNGVVFDAPAPIDIIMSGYTIAPLDDAGGHVNPNTGYHYHAATGKTQGIVQTDGHEAMIGYALDGYAIYEHSHDAELDDCLGHYDELRGYHYHADHEGSNNFINCFAGAIAVND